jgi:tetratricopeptide (TPR) repeat protein
MCRLALRQTQITMSNQRRNFLIGLAALAASTQVRADDEGAKPSSDAAISFHTAFPTPIYKKSYFGAALTGVTILGAGALTYFTAGAGAPAAATGVSTVASWVAGGGAGSYMAGLSTIGGWFGGNAMLGSAILNGISIGVIGGGTGALSALGKASIATSLSATMLDGVALFESPTTGSVETRVKLAVPTGIGTSEVKKLAKDIRKTEEDLYEAQADQDQTKIVELTQKMTELQAVASVKTQYAHQPGSNPEDLIVLGVLARNHGQHEVLDKALAHFDEHTVQSSAYLSYLGAVSVLEKGEALEEARNKLRTAMRLNDYALEPALLMINLLAYDKSFVKNEAEILRILQKYEESFDKDIYQTPFSLVSMHYRVGSLYLIDKRFEYALEHFTEAHGKLKLTERVLKRNPAINLIALGQANALYGMQETARADAIVDEILEDIESEEQADMIRKSYAGYIDRQADTI